MTHGLSLPISVSSLTGSGGEVLFLRQTSLEASNGYPAKGYSHLLHWSYKKFLNVFLIYSGEIRRMVPGKTSGTHFPDAAAHSPGKGVHLLQPGIFLLISGRCVPEHLFFFLVIADLVRKHLVIDKAAAADCFLYLNSLLFYLDRSLFLWRSSFFSPWLSIYCRIVSIGAPPALSRQELQQSVVGTFTGIDEFTAFRLWLRAEHHMNMVCIVIPFFQYDPYPGAIYSKISFALSDISSFSTFLLYFITKVII